MTVSMLEISDAECDEGNLVGRHPNSISLEEFQAAGIQLNTAMEGIRAKCLDCCGGIVAEVRKCTAFSCPLWTMRLGHYPRARNAK